MKNAVLLSGTGLVSPHLIGAPLADVEPGASLARHIPWLAATLGVVAAAALTHERLLRALRAAAAWTFAPVASFRSTDNIRLRAWYGRGRSDWAAAFPLSSF